jgi:hypothetical protein
MSRRKRTLLAVGLLVVVAGAGAFVVQHLASQRHCIDEAGAGKLKAGLTRQGVESILAVPPGDYRVEHDDIALLVAEVKMTHGGLMSASGPLLRWVSDTHVVYVCFHDNAVLWSSAMPISAQRTGLVAKIRRWLGL